ncbi:MAG: DNA mismatch repair endonuclease MutL [Acidobacteriia bacterium]|nr:DNA mismatch repair endonuclease MutL [Terriglobia bacterium]
MSRIRVLPEILANKIAAGEIVERPASVVKELLENSLDAGARALHLSVEAGGKKRIVVRDDGEGMTQDDAILAFEHHATSKLQSADDLAAIATLGFRGEALPSIASISRLTLRTRHEAEPDSAPGTEVEVHGGTMRSVKAIPWDRGTEVAVRDLFFNLPARRKFLRAHDTELGHITRLVTHYALARPELRFTLESEGRKLIDVVPVPSVRERAYQLFGDSFLKNLVEISGRAGDVAIHGFASQPHEQKTNPYSQFFYVNRRMVRDKVMTSAVRQAYLNSIPSSAYPVVLLFVELPYDQIDVNVHPAKTEVRFRDQSLVHDLIRESILRALVGTRSIPVYEHHGSANWPHAGIVPGGAAMAGDPDGGHAGPFDFSPPAFAPDPFQRAFNYPLREVPQIPPIPLADHHTLRMRPELLLGAPPDSAREIFHPVGVRILGQIQESYIIACDRDGLLIIDQHVAHERVLYEKIALAMSRNAVETQGLLVPVTIELAPHQAALLDRALPELNRNGFQVEGFGSNTVLVRSVPAVARELDCQKLLSEIVEGLEMEERTLDVERIKDRIAVSMACRAAIKVHMPLTIEKMQWLLDELGQTQIPTNCPHGRPIILRFSLYEIERNFGRA